MEVENVLNIGEVSLKCPDNFDLILTSGLDELNKIELSFNGLEHALVKQLYSYAKSGAKVECTGSDLCFFKKGDGLNLNITALVQINAHPETDKKTYFGYITLHRPLL